MSYNNNMMSVDCLPEAVKEIVSGAEPKIEESIEKDYDARLESLKLMLTPLQREVLALRLDGRHNAQIAELLSIKSKTVANVYEKIKHIARRNAL